jgi:hypothetical protein
MLKKEPAKCDRHQCHSPTEGKRCGTSSIRDGSEVGVESDSLQSPRPQRGYRGPQDRKRCLLRALRPTSSPLSHHHSRSRPITPIIPRLMAVSPRWPFYAFQQREGKSKSGSKEKKFSDPPLCSPYQDVYVGGGERHFRAKTNNLSKNHSHRKSWIPSDQHHLCGHPLIRSA